MVQLEENGEGLGAEHAHVVFHFQLLSFCVYVVYSGYFDTAVATHRALFWMTWSFILDVALMLGSHI